MQDSNQVNYSSSEKSFLQRLGDSIYIARRAWLTWIIPIIYAWLPTAVVWSFWYEYYKNYQNHIAWTAEKILQMKDVCDVAVLEKRKNDGKVTNPENCKVEIIQESTAWVTTEYRQSFYKDWVWDYTYGPITQVEKYPEWTKNYIKGLKGWDIYETKTYERAWEFLWLVPRVAPYSVIHKIPYEFNLHSPLWKEGTDFGKASEFKLIPWVNVPTDMELIDLWRSITNLIYGSDGKPYITISGIASPEWINPKSLIWDDPVSYEKNLRLAHDRAEYVKWRLIKFYPQLTESITEIYWLVSTLSPDQVEKLMTISKKLGINNEALQSIDILVKKFEDWTLSLSPEDIEYITSLFARSVKISLNQELNK